MTCRASPQSFLPLQRGPLVPTAAPSPTEEPPNVVLNIFSHERNVQLNSRVETTVLLLLLQGFAAER